MVTVTAWAGTSARVGKVSLVDLLPATGVVELDHLDGQGVVEIGHRGVVEGQMAVLPDTQAAEIEGMAPEQIGVARGLGAGSARPSR